MLTNIHLRIKGKKGLVPVRVDVLDTPESMADGYRTRAEPESGEGLLFVPDAPTQMGMWMKGVGFHLDLAYLNTKGKITQIEQLKANDPTIVRSRKPVSFALEVPAGFFIKSGVHVGSHVSLRENASQEGA